MKPASQLLSLLLEALSCPDQGVQLSTLSCLQPVLIDPPPDLIQQLEALVSRLLALIGSPAMVSEMSYSCMTYSVRGEFMPLYCEHVSSQDVRIASLRCLHALSRFPVHEVRLRWLRLLLTQDCSRRKTFLTVVYVLMLLPLCYLTVWNLCVTMWHCSHQIWSKTKPSCLLVRSCRFERGCCELWRSLWMTRRGWWGGRPFRLEESGKKRTFHFCVPVAW